MEHIIANIKLRQKDNAESNARSGLACSALKKVGSKLRKSPPRSHAYGNIWQQFQVEH